MMFKKGQQVKIVAPLEAFADMMFATESLPKAILKGPCFYSHWRSSLSSYIIYDKVKYWIYNKYIHPVSEQLMLFDL